MKIQSITNTNFKGLFTDKTAQNNGNWLMEYSPYSWENNNHSTMAKKERLDVFSSTLPDNEEIFSFWGERESSKDILGTESYFKEVNPDRMRTTITDVPAMDRESSLRVQNKKMGKFLEMKQAERKTMETLLGKYGAILSPLFDGYKRHSVQYDSSIFSRGSNKLSMDGFASEIEKSAKNLLDSVQKYIKLIGSTEAVNAQKECTAKEIEQLEKARMSGKLIDISRRDIYDPNRTLWLELNKMITANHFTSSEALVALPHKTISLQEILRAVGKSLKGGYNREEIIKYVDTLIHKAI